LIFLSWLTPCCDDVLYCMRKRKKANIIRDILKYYEEME